MTMHKERRKFSRIDFDARVELAQGTQNWQAHLLDISLKGVLLAKLGPFQLDTKEPILVKVILSNQTTIAMFTHLVQQSMENLRLACTSIDLDSVSHLRRLIELNLGSAEAAERELLELANQYE
jgi:hypothetical protein